MEYEKHPLFQELLGNRCFLRVYRPFHLLLADIYFLFHHGIKSSWQASLEIFYFSLSLMFLNSSLNPVIY